MRGIFQSQVAGEISIPETSARFCSLGRTRNISECSPMLAKDVGETLCWVATYENVINAEVYVFKSIF